MGPDDAAIGAQRITSMGPCGVMEPDDEYTERDVELSIFLPVAPGTTAEPPLVILGLPQQDCLVARVVGPYDQISQAHDLIRTPGGQRAVSAAGRQSRGKMFQQVLGHFGPGGPGRNS